MSCCDPPVPIFIAWADCPPIVSGFAPGGDGEGGDGEGGDDEGGDGGGLAVCLGRTCPVVVCVYSVYMVYREYRTSLLREMMLMVTNYCLKTCKTWQSS